MQTMNKKFVIELDCDGVMADTYGKMHSRLSAIMPNFSENDIRDYSMVELSQTNPEAYKAIHAAFRDANYMRSLDPYDGLADGIDLLLRLNASVCVHTLIVGDHNVVRARKEWLDEHVPHGVSYQIDHKIKKMFSGSHILIEDSPENIEKSDATYKILIKHPYNEAYAATHGEILVADNFKEAAELAAKLCV